MNFDITACSDDFAGFGDFIDELKGADVADIDKVVFFLESCGRKVFMRA